MEHRARQRSKRGIVALAAGLVGLAACASGPDMTAAPRERISMELVTAEGEPLSLARLRGEPVLIFVFTTFDDVCQLALTPLSRFAEEHPDVTIVGVAAQPDPAELLQLYGATLGVRFALAYDPQDRIVAGGSPLGAVPTVPTYIVLDAAGHEVARRDTAANEAQLAALIAEAR